MMTPFPPKTVMQMRRQAGPGASARPAPRPPGEIDPANRPQLHSETPLEADATHDWLAHIAAGRIEVR
ncbi:MAG TPA: hypothetical protein VF027_04915 [Sphingomicrobium sp.]